MYLDSWLCFILCFHFTNSSSRLQLCQGDEWRYQVLKLKVFEKIMYIFSIETLQISKRSSVLISISILDWISLHCRYPLYICNILVGFSIGSCFPSGCSVQDIFSVVQTIIEEVNTNSTIKMTVSCQEKNLEYSTGAIVTMWV